MVLGLAVGFLVTVGSYTSAELEEEAEAELLSRGGGIARPFAVSCAVAVPVCGAAFLVSLKPPRERMTPTVTTPATTTTPMATIQVARRFRELSSISGAVSACIALDGEESPVTVVCRFLPL